MNNDNLPLYELILKSDKDGVDKISLVSSPAIERNWIAFSEEESIKFKTVDETQQVLVGPCLLPDKKIIRLANDGSYYNIFFSKDTIKEISHRFLTNGFQTNWNVEHLENVDDVSVIESWIVENSLKDKSTNYGLTMPVGTWMIMTKVNNKEIWDEYISTNILRGFSVEVFADKVLHQQSKVDILEIPFEQLSVEEAEEVWTKIIKLLEEVRDNG